MGRAPAGNRALLQQGHARRRMPLTSNVRFQAMQRAVISIVAVLALALSACSELGAGTGQISKRIGELVSDPSAKEVDLSKLTSFGWDRFYYFKPGTSREDICKFIAANRNVCGRVFRYESVPPDYMALLFGLGGNLTHTELHALKNGRFEMALDESGFPKERSVFMIHRVSSGTDNDVVVLEPR